MSEVFFYKLMTDDPTDILRKLLIRLHQSGWKVLVRGVSEDDINSLDRNLWISPGDGFLPHAVVGGEFDSQQPILLTTGQESPNSPQALVLFGGADFYGDELGKRRRISIVFRSNFIDELKAARNQWSKLQKTDARLQYWSMDSGKWKLEAQHNLPKNN